MQSKRSRRLKAYFLRARWFIYNCTTYLSSNWVVNLTNASAVSVQLSSTLKRRYSLQLEWQHRVYSVHSQHRAIQGDNYNVPYYSQLSLWWILFKLVSTLDTCLSHTKSHEWSKEKRRWFLGVHFREVSLHWLNTHDTESSNETISWTSCTTKKYFLPTQISYYIVLCSWLSFNRHLWKKATSLKWTPRFVPCLSLLLSCNSTCTQDEYLS